VAPATTLAIAGLTATVATGTGVTVSVALPLFPSLVAVIVAVPGATELTTPALDTVATTVLSELQSIVRPVRTPPFASRVVAVAWVVCPASTDARARETVTAATGAGVTVRAALPLLPSLVATMFAAPGLIAVTSPVADTVAMVVFSELHVVLRPVSIPSFASRSVALACAVPTAVMELAVRATLTDATGAGMTVNVALPPFPSLVAVISAVPSETAVTNPV
jgi:hypothetical protein